MEFDPHNHIVQLCLQGMQMEMTGRPGEAKAIFENAWQEAANHFEKYLAAYYLAGHQDTAAGKLHWLEKTLALALEVNTVAVKTALPAIYSRIAACYQAMNNHEKANEYRALASSFTGKLYDSGPFYHGTRADLKEGDLLTAGGKSNYNAAITMNHIYFTAQVNGAGLAAALAKGEGRERVYIVVPTGSFENDPNVTDKKFPGNPTRSYRSLEALKIVGEVTDWERITPEQLQQWKEKLAANKGEIIN